MLSVSRFPRRLASVRPPNSAPPHCRTALSPALFPKKYFPVRSAGEVLHAHRSRKSSENPVTNDGSWCDRVGVRSMFTSSTVKWKGGDRFEYLFRTYELIAQGRNCGLRSPSCGLLHLLHLRTKTRALMSFESLWLLSKRSRFRPTRSLSGAFPIPTSSILYGPVPQCVSFDTNANDLRDDPSAGAFRTCLPPPLIVLLSS